MALIDVRIAELETIARKLHNLPVNPDARRAMIKKEVGDAVIFIDNEIEILKKIKRENNL